MGPGPAPGPGAQAAPVGPARRLLHLLRPEWRRCAAVVALLVVSTIGTITCGSLLLWYGARGAGLVAAMAARGPRLALATGLALPLLLLPSSALGRHKQLSGLALRVGILFYGGHLVTEGHLSTGDLVAFVLYQMQFTEAVEVLLSQYPEVTKAVGSLEKLFEYVERVPQVAPSGTLAPRDLQGHLELRDVWFSYPGREEPVLKGVSLEVRPGEVLALLGAAGSGKSTLVALLQRLREPARGHLLLDGRDARDYALPFLRAQVSVVPAEPTLLARSLHDNVALGTRGQSRCHVEAAARAAGAHRFIARLPHGYDTDVGKLGGLMTIVTPVTPRAALRRLLRLTAPEWPHLSGAFVFLALAVVGETLVPYYTGKVIDLLRNDFDADAFTSAIIFMGLASLGSSVFAGCRGGFFLWVLSRLNIRVCDRLFSHLLRQEMAFFEQVKAADLASRLAHDVPMMNQVVPANANIFLRNLVKALVLLAFMGRLSWRLTVLALVEVPLAVAARKLYEVRHQALLQAILEATARASAVAHEAVAAIETVQGFGAETGEVERYATALDETRRLKERRDLERSLFLLFQRALQVAGQALVLYCAHQHIAQGALTAGGLVSFILYQGDLSRHLQALVYVYGNTLSSVGAARKVFEYLDREPAVALDGTWAPATLRGHVVFQNVTFAYPTRPEEPALQDVSFELRPGEVTALAGLNGSGKSTCVALLERFYEPQAGAVLLDGVPLHDYEHEYLHRQVALVAQEPVLFSGSIRDNIAYGLEGCGAARVEAAARARVGKDEELQVMVIGVMKATAKEKGPKQLPR
ncbi:antigen peptide transporter 2-like [Nothoprocta perdicaria]|uniref:antigen peptide transporter 2-like n=1 Tax=Nothoprocta perdicaria TaxID=30464 RepID=UPI000E1B5CAD|nr:antigen peptide transporter 2-like [Nothoprocta perdicaria]